ncbi:hypothetical protein HII31_07770 [Pseudocercospora fuligena]|uniref:Uncharacterized protein n=1 Tax=Pseudocercospora fuligena TaxID=685502 RepID=A0A8H6RIF0_9PEZI|nr:hypothetical protein HII31_07770 [Pseudocercospora fuligena]
MRPLHTVLGIVCASNAKEGIQNDINSLIALQCTSQSFTFIFSFLHLTSTMAFYHQALALFLFSTSILASAITKNPLHHLLIRQEDNTQCPSQPSSFCICYNDQGTQGPEGKENSVTTAVCQALGGSAQGGFGAVDPEYPCGGDGPTVAVSHERPSVARAHNEWDQRKTSDGC